MPKCFDCNEKGKGAEVLLRSRGGGGQRAAELEAPDTVPADEKVEDVLAVCGLAARLGVDLGVGQAGSIAKEVLPHIGGGDQVRVAAAVMTGQVAQNIRLTGG